MLFSPLFVPPRLSDAVSDRAWIDAMLETEAALTRAEAHAGLIPDAAAEEIADACTAGHFDPAAIAREARGVGNPAEPLVRALRRSVSENAARYVHFGATSQDILDTASMLVAKRALAIIEGDLEGVAGHCARLAEEQRDTLMAGRTLLQHALPITFGLKAAQWLSGVTRARETLRRLHDDCLAAELGGAAGTLAALGDAGPAVLREYSRLLDLAEPALPWHTERTRVAQIGSALGITAGALDKIALDIVLLAQTEVGEVTEGGGGGGSSTMPQKRNPVGSVLTRACAREALANVETLMRAMEQEHERAAGAWHTEWQALSGALAFTGGGASWLNEVLEGLQVHLERMRENLHMTGGAVMAERITLLLAERMGREEAHNLLRTVTRQSSESGRSLQGALSANIDVRRHMSAEEIDHAMDPATYLGSTQAFIDRALALHEAFKEK